MPRTLWSDPEKRLLIKDLQPNPLAPYEVRVRVHYSYVSAGTELTQLQMGPQVNAKRPIPSAPLGYSVAGEVIEVGEAVSHVEPGQRVVAIGAGAFHAEEVVVARNLVVMIPAGVSTRDAAPVAMMCFALEGVRKANLALGENVLVAGAGLMGQFASQFALASGARVFLTDRNTHRLEFAVDGVETFAGDDEGWSWLRETTAPIGLEAALVCAGGDATPLVDLIRGAMTRSPEGVAHGRVVFSGGATVRIPFASPSGNIRFYSSAKAGPGYRDQAFEAGRDYPQGYVKWPVYRNMAVALRAVQQGQLRVAPLITHEYALDEAPAVYESLATPNASALALLFRYAAADDAQ